MWSVCFKQEDWVCMWVIVYASVCVCVWAGRNVLLWSWIFLVYVGMHLILVISFERVVNLFACNAVFTSNWACISHVFVFLNVLIKCVYRWSALQLICVYSWSALRLIPWQWKTPILPSCQRVRLMMWLVQTTLLNRYSYVHNQIEFYSLSLVMFLSFISNYKRKGVYCAGHQMWISISNS